MAGRNTSYTHRHWRVAATDMRNAITDVLAPALDHMRAGLVRADAGRTQLKMAAQLVVFTRDLGEQGTRILAAHDARLRRVGEAQAAAGHAEVAGHKDYHQR